MRSLAVVALTLCFIGCNSDRIVKLEAQQAEQQREIQLLQATGRLELQAQCAKSAKQWFDERWAAGRDRDTLYLDYTNHYNTVENKCFVNVEFHFNTVGGGWTNSMSTYDVLENVCYGDFIEQHALDGNRLPECSVYQKQCKSIEEYQSLTRPIMTQ